jgi:hypothetical protein
MPQASRIKCPGCSNAITLPTAAGGKRNSGAKPAGNASLTPEDEGFDFGQIQFPSAGPTAVSTFQTGGQPLNPYQGPIPGDPLGEELGTESEDGEPLPDGAKRKSKAKGTLSPKALAAILGGTAVLLLIAILVGTMLAGDGDSGSGDDGSGQAAASSDAG